jgi:hypothetical protein
MTINWKTFITKDYWLGIDRTGLHLTDTVILYAGGALVVIGLLCLVYKFSAKNEFLKKVTGQFATILITVGLLEGIWFLLRWQYVSALGTRVVAALIAVMGLIWLYWPVKYLLTRYKQDMAEAQRKITRDKYLQR